MWNKVLLMHALQFFCLFLGVGGLDMMSLEALFCNLPYDKAGGKELGAGNSFLILILKYNTHNPVL